MANDGPAGTRGDLRDEHQVSLRERVKRPPAPALVDGYYARSVAADLKYRFDEDMRIHLAHGVMLVRQGIVGRADMARILETVLRLREDGPDALAIDYRQEDLYSYTESHIVRVLGPETGGRLHTGRSRNDLNVTSWRMALRVRLHALLTGLAGLRATVLRLAGEHAGTVMPGYTHTQHAQPISLGYYLLSVADLLARDADRLRAALDRCDRSPLGAGALTTTGFPIDRELAARLLGFGGLVEVAYDAVSCRDDAVEAASAIAVMMTGLSRLGTDLLAWNTLEYGFVELADEYSSVSSIMPQKKNPQAIEYLRAAAAHCTGALTTALACMKNTSLADVNDGVTAVNAPVLDSVERASQALQVVDGVLQTMTIRPEAMRRSAEIGFGTATELADAIVLETGLSFRMAHNIVGRVVRETVEAGRTALDITAEEVDQAAEALFGRRLGLSPDVVRRALDPAENLRSRTVTGGPAPEMVREMVARRRDDLAREQTGLEGVRERWDEADRMLATEVADIRQVGRAA